jgi:hypothetical protein
MEKSYYFVRFKPAYFRLSALRTGQSDLAQVEDVETRRVILSITQGGFGQDVVDDEEQTKQRFLEYLFAEEDIDLPRTAEVFDQYFELHRADEIIDLDDLSSGT